MRALLRQAPFRNLWAGQTLSSVGDAMIVVVIGLYLTQESGSSRDVGLVLAAYAAPLVLFLLVGGVLADRLPRRGLMIATDLVRAGLHGLLAVLILLDAVQLWHMLVIGVLFGAAEAFFRPAYTGLLPATVQEHEIQTAQAVTAASRETAIIAGPAIGTALVFGLGASAAFALDALTFVASVVFLLRVRPRRRGYDHVPASFLADLREGWVAVRERTWVWATICGFSVALLCGLAPFFTLGAAVSEAGYGTAAIFGIVQISWGAGTLAGSLVAVRWRPRRPMLTGILWTLPWPLTFAVFALAAPEVALFAGTAAGGFGVGMFGVWWETALAERIPPQLLSRVSAYDWMGSLALLPAGYVLAGLIGDAVGPQSTLLVGAGVALLALAAALLPRQTRTLRAIPRGQTVAAAQAQELPDPPPPVAVTVP